MTEVRIVPRVRTETETIQTPVSKCGDNWFQPVKIRSPYKKTDVAFRTLPSLGDPEQVESFDPLFLDEIKGDYVRIKGFFETHSGLLTSRQQSNILKMLDRAARYLRDAKIISKTWENGFATTTAGTVPAWPLGGQPKSPVNSHMDEGHRRDEEKYKKLVRSALKNLRCSEEVTKKATIRARNKERHGGRRFANVSGIGPTDQIPGGSLPGGATQAEFVPIESSTASIRGQTADFDKGELEEGDIVLDEEADIPPEDGIDEEPQEDTAPSQKKAKKKDNTLLIAGAAALGIMALKGR